jgi:hypothetical protein
MRDNVYLIQTDVYNSFIPLEVKDSSLRLYVCHHNNEGNVVSVLSYH